MRWVILLQMSGSLREIKIKRYINFENLVPYQYRECYFIFFYNNLTLFRNYSVWKPNLDSALHIVSCFNPYDCEEFNPFGIITSSSWGWFSFSRVGASEHTFSLSGSLFLVEDIKQRIICRQMRRRPAASRTGPIIWNSVVLERKYLSIRRCPQSRNSNLLR